MLDALGKLFKPTDPAEKAARSVAKIEGRTTVRAAKAAARSERQERRAEQKARRKKLSIEKMIIAVADRGYLAALLGACFVAYMLDAIFFFQQTTLIWLSLLLCLFGIVIRTIAITGGVVLQSAEEEEGKAPPDSMEKDNWLLRQLKRFGRILGRFSLARTTMRTVTVCCWIACAFASLSFFASGQEMRTFANESIEKLEQTSVVGNDTLIKTLNDEIAGLETDKKDIRADRDNLIAGARKSMTEAQTDGSTENDDLTIYERNIARYNSEAADDIKKKDADIETKRGEIRKLQSGSGQAAIHAQEQRAETPPFLAVYVFLARLTGLVTDNVTTWVSIFFAIVLELLVDTGLQNYFGMKKKHARRLRAIEARELIEEAEWKINRFNMEATANLQFAKAQALAAENHAMQEQANAAIEARVKKAQAQADAARQGIPYVDPDREAAVQQKLRDAETDERIAKIEADIRDAAARAERLRNPPPDPSSPSVRGKKGGDATKHRNEAAGANDHVPVDDWSGRTAGATT